jgi:hypothetical protein
MAWDSRAGRALRVALIATPVMVTLDWRGMGGRTTPWSDHLRPLDEVLARAPIAFAILFALSVLLDLGKT